MASTGRGVERVLAKLNRSVQEGNYYEAHQMYRTLYFRYSGQKKYTEAIDLLYNGSVTLLKHNQHGSGADLALLLLDVLKKASATVNDDIIDRLSTIHGMINKEHIERPNFLSRAIQWSAQGEHKSGHPQLHQKLAYNFWREKSYTQSRYHFVRCGDGEGCAIMLVEFHVSAGFASEVDLFIAQTVFQYLCLSNKSTAASCLTSYTKHHPQVETGPPYIRPLLNFLWLLMLAIEGGKVAVFTILCEQYQTALQRDASYSEYLDRIGQLFFGVPPPQNQSQQGLLGNLMSSLFNMGDDEEDEDGASSFMPPQSVDLD